MPGVLTYNERWMSEDDAKDEEIEAYHAECRAAEADRNARLDAIIEQVQAMGDQLEALSSAA